MDTHIIDILTPFIGGLALPGRKYILDGIDEDGFALLKEGESVFTYDTMREVVSIWDGRHYVPGFRYSVTLTGSWASEWNALKKAETEEKRKSPKSFSTLSIDIETYSSADLSKCGLYKYAESDDFEILLFGYSLDFGEVDVIDLAGGETLPDWIIRALTDNAVLKTAFNAAFERTCLSKYLGMRLDPAGWDCTMVRCSMMGLPRSLQMVGEALDLERLKMDEGKDLIRYFSLPCKPTKRNGGRTRNRFSDDPEKWTLFKTYNKRDVEVENDIRKRTSGFHASPLEPALYAMDQNINDRGVKVDLALVTNAIEIDGRYSSALADEAARITGLDNPNSVIRLKEWLGGVDKLDKKAMPELKEAYRHDPEKLRMLEIRSELGKTSITKYTVMQTTACRDSRIRGLLQFYGTNTGRWAGRLVQVQNLPQNHIGNLDECRNMVLSMDMEGLSGMDVSIPDILSQLIRTAFVAEDGKTFIVCDFSAIEARVIAWLAGEQWRLNVFRTSGKIYEASAAKMYHCDPSEITKTDPRRQKGKIAELALGYGGGVGALQKMGGEKMGLSEDEMKEIVDGWRKASPAIVGLWGSFELAARRTLRTQSRVQTLKGVTFRAELDSLTVSLPSGRKLFYPGAGIGDFTDRFGKTHYNSINFMSVNQTTRKWEMETTYGGKLTENIVQAIARDCLAVTLLRLERAGYPVVFHVHDEAIMEVPDNGTKTVDEVKRIFSAPIQWAEGLPLVGDGYVTKYYLKD